LAQRSFLARLFERLWPARRQRVANVAYAGAQVNRLYQDRFFAQLQSANEEIRTSLKRLRARSRDLARNNPYGSRFVGLVVENVVGPTGIGLQARVQTGDGVLDQEVNAQIEEAWRDWSKAENASADGVLSWTGIQQLIFRTLPQDGEYIVRLLPGFDNRHGFAVQVLDPDQLDIDLNRAREAGGNEIRMGVEMDRWGRRVAFHLWTSHPADFRTPRERVRVPASQIVHGFLVMRAGQVRGVPWFAPIVLRSMMLDGSDEAHLTATRVGASKMGFFRTRPEDEPDPDAVGADEPLVMEAEPGTFEDIGNREFVEWSPDYPAASYPAFVKAMLRAIATGVAVSYNTLANDLEGVNFSSIRAGLLTERDVWRLLQRWAIEHLHERVYMTWLRQAMTSGVLRLPSMIAEEWSAHVWQPRGWQWVDPLKEVAAAEKAIGLGLKSRTMICAEHGLDFEDVLRDLRREQELAAQYGVSIAPAGESAPVPVPDDDDDEAPRRPANAVAAASRLLHVLNGNGVP
jgi:lambda family phage portal protein